MPILITGGAGYIGSQTCLELLRAGHDVVVVDNLSNSNAEALRRVAELAGREFLFHEDDIRDAGAMERIFGDHQIESVIHFAALKAVGESVQQPLRYWDNNVTGTLVLLDRMSKAGVKRLVFSSSCTVYGDPRSVPIREDAPLSAVNPYGATKVAVEQILKELHRSDPEWRIASLRYFNPVGADPSGRIGEDPNGVPSNLVPFITQVAVGRHPSVKIYGNDYPTKDGTGVRDYIHVVDLALGHLAALRRLDASPGLLCANLGTGKGYSVLDMIKAVERAVGKKVPYEIVPRRPGDTAEAWADPSFAERELGWKATRDLDTMARDAWRWQRENPAGYKGSGE